MPVKYGEKVVLRLLERGKNFDLHAYPLEDGAKKALMGALEKKQGLIIITGPTGSGKSTLMYSGLSYLDRNSLNVSTVEDPIEYELEGVNQSQVAKENDMTFDAALRALMRQDPDVILVGEIRDEETAKSAIHAACTGHLVLTTLHANSTEEIVTRMAGLGVKKEILEDTILFASAQRLPKKLCESCKSEDLDSMVRLKNIFPNEHIDFTPFKAVGCGECHNGIKGRVMLFEYMKKNEHKKGLDVYGSLKESAFLALKNGTISVGEAYAQFA